MSEENRTVQMYLIDPGSAAADGEFTFEMQSRNNAGRTVRFSLCPSEAHLLLNSLGEYFKVPR